MSEAQFRWVHYNHGEPGSRPEPPIETARTQSRKQWETAKRGRTSAAGEIARSLLASRTRLSELQRRLLQVIEEDAGAELLTHVAAVNVRRGLLTVESGEPAVLYDLRLRWEQKILRMVQAKLPDLGIHSVRFMLAKSDERPDPGR